MKRVLSAAAILLFFASCHGDGVGMEWDAGLNPSVSEQAQMEEITVTEYGPVITDSITVDAGRGISRSMEPSYDTDTSYNSCTGSAELSEEDYESVKTVIIVADLANYVPPDTATCDPFVGVQEISVVFKTVVGEEFAFDTGPCEIEEEIGNIRLVLAGLADDYITDCRGARFVVTPGDDDADGDCIPDAVESATGTDPNKVDTDGDGLPDGWVEEKGMGEDVNCNGVRDVDEDGRFMETDPRKADSDDDGISDYDEMVYDGPPIVIEDL